MNYTNLLIRIGGFNEADNAYPVEAELDDGSLFFGGRLELDLVELRAFDLDDFKYGEYLFHALANGPIRRAFDIAEGRSRASSDGRLRIGLWIDPAAAELQALRWERLIDDFKTHSHPLSAMAKTPFSRYFRLDMPEPQALDVRPVKVLIAVANPTGLGDRLAEVDVDAEIENLRLALGSLRATGRIDIALLPGRTGLSDSLREKLEREKYEIIQGATTLERISNELADRHMFFYVGHGAFRRRGSERGTGNTALFLEDEDGSVKPTVDTEIASQLEGMDPGPYLIFLVACESAVRDMNDRNPFVGLGPRLIEAGVPAVVAMQDEVTMESARTLIRSFGRWLTEHGMVDRALNQARQALIAGRRPDWSIPVLFTRMGDGVLFAPNPIESALQGLREKQKSFENEDHLPLPIDVLHLAGDTEFETFDVNQLDASAAVDLLATALGIMDGKFSPEDSTRGTMTVLIGESGTAKTTKMQQVAAISLISEPGELPVLPLLVNLDVPPTSRTGLKTEVEAMIFESLGEVYPELTVPVFSKMLRGQAHVRLRILLDGSDLLSEQRRGILWRGVKSVVRRYPRTHYLLSTDPDYYQQKRLNPTDILYIQPLSERKVKNFLDSQGSPQSRSLMLQLKRHRLFDLAAVPWLMARMVTDANNNIFPQSRTSVMANVVDEAIGDMQGGNGMRARVKDTLYQLAWIMQNRRVSMLRLDETLEIIAEVRGRREYGLHTMFESLLDVGLLTRVGDDGMRFAFGPVQSYCAAVALDRLEDTKRRELVDDITASLGRLSRLRWWEDTLVYLSGLRHNKSLMEQIVYGVNLFDNEQTSLVVRCLGEARSNQKHWSDLRQQVLDALVLRLDVKNEPNNNRRMRAIEALGQLEEKDGLDYLVTLANRKNRVDRNGEPEFEPSYIRLTALQSLMRQMPAIAPQIRQADVLLADILRAWQSHDHDGLLEGLNGDDPAQIVLSAFALADRQPAGSLAAIINVFKQLPSENQVGWALAEAMALYDPDRVTEQAILPLIDEESAVSADIDEAIWKRREVYHRILAYLIGKISSRTPRCLQFLQESLREPDKSWQLRGKAIEALGWVSGNEHRELFEQIAVGQFEGIAMPEGETRKTAERYLQRKALIALAYVGNLATLTNVRKAQMNWTPDLERTFYQTSEEIYSRINLRR